MEGKLTDNINPYLESTEGQSYLDSLEQLQREIDVTVPVEKKKDRKKEALVPEVVEEPTAKAVYVTVALHQALPKEGKVIAYNVGPNKEYRYIEASLFYANKSFTEAEWRGFPIVVKKGAK